ncbi:MAG TPA: hypothetical protein V6C69_07955 [Trichormus sp.]|jgi:hypothetical protein
MVSGKRIITKSESYGMGDDGSISIDVFIDGAGAVPGVAHASIKVGEALHAQLLERFANLQPGADSITIRTDMTLHDDEDDDDSPTLDELARWQIAKARNLAIGLAMVGRRFESAVMVETGNLMMSSQGALPSGQITTANWDVRRDDPHYAATCIRFNVHNPGDMGAIEYRRVDDKWLNVITNQFEDPD